jgi:hypothetical protein
MPLPSGRPDNVINAMRKGFDGRMVWPKASTGSEEERYQNLAVTYDYIAFVDEAGGFMLADGGKRVMQEPGV